MMKKAQTYKQHLLPWQGTFEDFFLEEDPLDLLEFQERLSFTFFPIIQFKDLSILQDVIKASKKKAPLDQEMALGLKYQAEIESGYFKKVQVQHVPKIQGYGLFARQKIHKGELIGEYVGEIQQKTFFMASDYLYRYPALDKEGIPYLINAKNGNLMRFANHSKNGNMTPTTLFLDPFYHVVFFANKTIMPNEQLLYDYGDNYWFTRRIPEIF
jgi:hypothetical protein